MVRKYLFILYILFIFGLASKSLHAQCPDLNQDKEGFIASVHAATHIPNLQRYAFTYEKYIWYIEKDPYDFFMKQGFKRSPFIESFTSEGHQKEGKKLRCFYVAHYYPYGSTIRDDFKFRISRNDSE